MKTRRLKLAKGLSRRQAWTKIRERTGILAHQAKTWTYNRATGWASVTKR